MAQRAVIEAKYAPLLSDFARSLLARHFGERLTLEIYERVPRYQRGPKKGQPKGWVRWDKVVKGGWRSDGPSYHGSPNGHVELPGTRNVRVALSFEDERNAFNPRQLPSSLTEDELVEYFDRFVTNTVAAAKRAW